jgi:hypothetical protein
MGVTLKFIFSTDQSAMSTLSSAVVKFINTNVYSTVSYMIGYWIVKEGWNAT